MASRGLKICLGVSALFLIIFATVIVALIFTVFKLKDPQVTLHPIALENFTVSPATSGNASLGMMIRIVNPNYGSFTYKNNTGYVNYDGNVVGEIPLVENVIPARSTVDVVTTTNFMVQKLMQDHKFLVDAGSGTVNFTSIATLPGKVGILKVIKLKATNYLSCDIWFKVVTKHMDSKCVSKIKLK